MRGISPKRGGLFALGAASVGAMFVNVLPVGALDEAPPPRDISEFACPVGVPDAGYTDVSPTDPAAPAIDCITWWGLAQGMTATTFAPNGLVRRDQMASFVARFIDSIDEALLPADAILSFVDVSPGSVHATAIARLTEAGIVQGTGGDTYSPSMSLTREQAASLLARALNFVFGESPVSGPVCSPVGDFYTDDDGRTGEDCVNGLTDVQVITGTAPGLFAPTGTLSRRQMGTLLARGLDLAVEQLSPPPLT